MMTLEEIQSHRVVAGLEADFLARFPGASDGVVYEFDTEFEAQTARGLLMTAASVAGRGRVVGTPWKNKQRLIAFYA